MDPEADAADPDAAGRREVTGSQDPPQLRTDQVPPRQRTDQVAPRLRTDRLTVRYGNLVAVDHVDLVVQPGEVVALVGPSGCGKSSLLAAVAGLVAHGGRVQIDGRDVTRAGPDRRDLGLMFQSGALFPHLDVADNIAFGPRMRRWSGARTRQRVTEVLDLVGLSGLGPRRIDELSGGQAQRVALARAIASQPRLLLLDEPLSSLDRRLRDRLLEELPAVFATVEAAVIHVTHDLEEALVVADRIVIMDHGQIVRAGTPIDLWRDPGSIFAAEFLGWRNLFEVTVSDGVATLPWGSSIPAPVDGHIVAVASDRVEVVADDRRSREGAIPGRIAGRRFAGDHVAVEVALPGDTTLHATWPGATMPAIGQSVLVTILGDAWRWLADDTPDG